MIGFHFTQIYMKPIIQRFRSLIQVNQRNIIGGVVGIVISSISKLLFGVVLILKWVTVILDFG
jgi:hypothetical protein